MRNLTVGTVVVVTKVNWMSVKTEMNQKRSGYVGVVPHPKLLWDMDILMRGDVCGTVIEEYDSPTFDIKVEFENGQTFRLRRSWVTTV